MGSEAWEWARWIGGLILSGFAILAGIILRKAGKDLENTNARIDAVSDDVEQMGKNMNAHVLDVANYKRHVSESHPTKGDIAQIQQQNHDSLSRIHGRIDVMVQDIKQILLMVGGNSRQ